MVFLNSSPPPPFDSYSLLLHYYELGRTYRYLFFLSILVDGNNKFLPPPLPLLLLLHDAF